MDNVSMAQYVEDLKKTGQKYKPIHKMIYFHSLCIQISVGVFESSEHGKSQKTTKSKHFTKNV